MKTVFSKLAAAAWLALMTKALGCWRSNSIADSTTPATPGQPVVVSTEGQNEINRPTNALTEAGAKTAADAGSKVEGILERAKTLVDQARWADALALLESLNGQALQPKQAAVVQSLKRQAQQKIEVLNKTADGVLITTEVSSIRTSSSLRHRDRGGFANVVTSMVNNVMARPDQENLSFYD